MPAITVHLPASITSPEPSRDIVCEVTTVGDALLQVAAQAPRYEQQLFYGDRLLVIVTLNGLHLPPAEVKGTAVVDGDRVEVLPPVAGG